jgi:hypothetical protein
MGISHPSLVEVDGWDVAIPLAIPVLVSAVPLGARRRWMERARTTSAVVLGGFVVVTLASIGLPYLPAFVAMLMAASSSRGKTEGDRASRIPRIGGTALSVRYLLKLAGVVTMASVGSLVIYAFGAGYLSGYGLWVPTPWNFLVSIVLLLALVVGAVRLVRPTSRGGAIR